MADIREDDLIESIAEGFRFISHTHPPDFIRAMAGAWAAEESPAAKAAIAQVLVNARMSLLGRRAICQDTGTAHVAVEIGAGARILTRRPLQELADEGVRRAWGDALNPLRASMVRDPLFDRTNTGDNTPAMVELSHGAGEGLDVTLVAKGGGSENKARFAVLEPSEEVADWVVGEVARMGAGWCPPGVLGIGVGGSADRAMKLAKAALTEPVDLPALRRRGPATRAEAFRLALAARIDALGIGAQGLGGRVTVLDVKLRTYPTHAASLPVALIPNCAATRHVRFTLDGSGPARFVPPDPADWPELLRTEAEAGFRRLDLGALDAATVAGLRAGERLLLSGPLLTGRDAAHLRMVEHLRRGEALPFDLAGRAIYYVGPVEAAPGEVIGPAGPTTATRMDRFTGEVLAGTGLRLMIGKAERGPEAVAAIARHGAAYLVATGGAAFLIAQAVRSARTVAWPDLGMEAVRELVVEDFPATVAVDARGVSVHETGPRLWARTPG